MELRRHAIRLEGQHITLRPMTEADWDVLLVWNNDADMLYFVEGDEVSGRSLEEVQAIYRHISRQAFCFIIESEGKPIGECWLQQLNLDRIRLHFPQADCRRIDLMIGDKACWGRGLGTEVVGLLTVFAFGQEQADFVFGCDVADYSFASQKVFQKVGYSLHGCIPQEAGAKARKCFDFILSRADFEKHPER